MSSDAAEEIKTWHQQQQDKVFNFCKEMVDFLQDVRILLSVLQVHEDFDLMGFDGMAVLHNCLKNNDVFCTVF